MYDLDRKAMNRPIDKLTDTMQIYQTPLMLLVQCVLVSAGIELIFFLVAGTVLCFGFSVRIMLITH